jgi:hypothetical protein
MSDTTTLHLHLHLHLHLRLLPLSSYPLILTPSYTPHHFKLEVVRSGSKQALFVKKSPAIRMIAPEILSIQGVRRKDNFLPQLRQQRPRCSISKTTPRPRSSARERRRRSPAVVRLDNSSVKQVWSILARVSRCPTEASSRKSSRRRPARLRAYWHSHVHCGYDRP